MRIPRGRLFVAERILRPIKKPVWYAVHAVSGIRMQMPTHYFDASMFSASFRVPLSKVKGLLPRPELAPLECTPEFAEILIAANEFRHVDILYPYNEVDIAIPVSYGPTKNTVVASALWHLHLPVSTDDARWPGVENYGFPKFVCEIDINHSAGSAQCVLIHDHRNVLSISVKRVDTTFARWEVGNITLRNGRLFHSVFSAQGQKGVDQSPGGGSVSFGDHPIAEQLQALKIESTSFRHEYMPTAEGTLSIALKMND
jgi:hypothetical protein